MRELIILGTASQVPTRRRNHNGYVLLWDGAGILFDPGEGTQRQMLLAGVPVSALTRICVTHLHGDHCLGLPGVVQRLSLDGVAHPVDLHFPASGQRYVDHLVHASVFTELAEVRQRPVDRDGVVDAGPPFAVVARRLDHEPDTYGWRIEEPPGRTMLPERLAALGVHGPAVAELQRAGSLRVGGRTVDLHDVSVERPGQVAAFVMDTRLCDAAVSLAADADLLVCEATFSSADADLATRYRHLTAGQAGTIAAEAGARRLVITHFSQRYPDERVLLDEASAAFPDVVAATDLLRMPFPPRRGQRHAAAT
ncbi:MAG: ribonuclease Z [Actinomycetota bacterium]|nr:ribonuclease Z [Actinomycetota bacterium]